MFLDVFTRYPREAVAERIYRATEAEAARALRSDRLGAGEIHPLFSPAADALLEEMAHRSAAITRRRFGNTVQLYAPLYLSNECNSRCRYCGFNADNKIRRVTLTLDQVRAEAEALHAQGFRHLLLLTGESRKAVPPGDLAAVAKSLRRRYASLSIEVYPMETEEYALLAAAGIDGLTLYQETYDRTRYEELHPSGKKRDFLWRLAGPDRGGMAGFRRLGIGALLGLADWRVDGFYTALHALYLGERYWRSQAQVSFPRIREAPGGFVPPVTVTDRDLVHLICVMRIILPDAPLYLSTREPAELRDHLMPLGITSMSAGSRTGPGDTPMSARGTGSSMCATPGRPSRWPRPYGPGVLTRCGKTGTGIYREAQRVYLSTDCA